MNMDLGNFKVNKGIIIIFTSFLDFTTIAF